LNAIDIVLNNTYFLFYIII